MTVSTLRPNGASSGLATGWTVTGAGDIFTATSDDSDSSYGASSTTGQQILDLSSVTIPTQARQISLTVRIRADLSSGGPSTIQVRVDGATNNYNNDNYNVSTTKTTQTGTAFPISNVSQAELDSLQVKITGAANLRVYEVYIDFTYNEAPTTTVTAPADPETNTVTPTVTWTYTDAEGDVENQWEILVWEAAEYSSVGFSLDAYYSTTLRGYYWNGAYHVPAWRSGSSTSTSGQVFSSALSAIVGNNLENGKTYRAYVRVGDSGSSSTGSNGGPRGPWAYKQFTVTLTPPGAPTVTVTAEPTSGRVKIEATAAAGSPTTEYFTVERSDDGGATWQTVRGGEQLVNAPVNTLRPNATVANPVGAFLPWTAIGAASVHAALSDDRLESYIQGSGSSTTNDVRVSFPNGAITGGSTITSVSVRLKHYDPYVGSVVDVYLDVSGAGPTVVENFGGTNSQIIVETRSAGTGGPSGSGWTMSDIDGLEAQIIASAGQAPYAKIYELYIDVFNTGGKNVLYDYECPLNTPLTYRVRAVDTSTPPYVLASSSTTATVTLTSTDWWLKDPTDPVRNLLLTPSVKGPEQELDSDIDQAVYSPMGRESYVVVNDAIKSEKLILHLEFTARADYDAFELLRTSKRTLLLQRGFTSDQWYVQLGNRKWTVTNHSPALHRVDIPCTEVLIP